MTWDLSNGTLGRHGLARRRDQDTSIWRQVSCSLVNRFEGDPRAIAKRCGYRAPAMLDEIRRRDPGGGFPWLRGPKIGPLWIRMIADEVGLPLLDLGNVPLPVDVHVARASWACGALSGTYSGSVGDIASQISAVWASACEGEDFYPLQLDQALWLQSRDGCTHRSGAGCPRESECVLSHLCVDGTISIVDGQMSAATRLSSSERPSPQATAPASGNPWERIVALAGADGFRTVRGLPVRYSIEGDTVVVAGRSGARIPRSDFELALAHAPLNGVADVPESCWGRSYIFAILRDPRIKRQDR